jgi:hypothetical protein
VKKKRWIFIAVIFICSLESLSHILSIAKGIQPARHVTFLDRILLSPSSLVFDRKPGFYNHMFYKLILKDKTVRYYKFVEAKEPPSNYLERILIRRAFMPQFSLKARIAMFCKLDSPLLIGKSITQPIDAVEINYLSPFPKRIICP